jgi:hypothetical protein
MNVGPVSSRNLLVPPGHERARPDTAARSVGKADPGVSRPASVEVTKVEAAGESRGVLRLLQQGHFRGVADVRLRINFHDELGAVEAETLKRETSEQVTSLVNSVNERISDLSSADWLDEESSAALDEQRVAFGHAIEELLESFSDSNAIGQGELIFGLQAAFDELVAGLPDADSISDGASFVGELREVLGEALAGIERRLDATDVLPTLSEARGNGGAYEKFLAIYRELISASEPAPSDGDARFEVIA